MKLWSRFLDALYPAGCACPLCGREAVLGLEGVCPGCLPLPLVTEPLPCPPDLDGLAAGLVYTGTVENAVKRFKYQRQVWLAPFLAGFIQLPPDWRIDCILPVPLHFFRQWQRTFNQSELLSVQLGRRCSLPVRVDLLRRVRYTSPQARLSAHRRRDNLTGAFRASPGVKGLSLLLVDDVTTTHATLTECARALKSAGPNRRSPGSRFRCMGK